MKKSEFSINILNDSGRLSQLKKAFFKLLEMVITGIIFAVVAALLTAHIMEHKEKQRATKNQLDNLSNVYIGCSKQWADEAFGYPQFVGQKDEYLLCAYTSDYFILQIAYDQSQSAQAYLITSLDNSEDVDLQINDSTLPITESFILGELSYYDFPGAPESVYGFVSNGTGRIFYSESYYFMSGGNYYNYHIASFDYGKTGKNSQGFTSGLILPDDEPIDDEVSISQNYGMLMMEDRKNNYPNSYGVSTPNMDIGSLLFSYDWFNSMQLRNNLKII